MVATCSRDKKERLQLITDLLLFESSAPDLVDIFDQAEQIRHNINGLRVEIGANTKKNMYEYGFEEDSFIVTKISS